MRILLLGFTKVSYMPYLRFYLDALKECGSELHVLVWNRDGERDSDLPAGIRTHEFRLDQPDEAPRSTKLAAFYRYRRYAVRVLRECDFDFIIVLSTIPAMLLADLLLGEYTRRYVFDYRDITYERIRLYRALVGRLVKNSAATFISSNGFRRYLPEVPHVRTTHNLQTEALAYRNVRARQSRDQSPIRVRFWGLIRHQSINTIIIDRLAGDSRFEVHYHGRSEVIGATLQRYCRERRVSNVFFHGPYMPRDRYQFIAETDLIHNLYDNDARTVLAMGNKFYDGIVHYIPQVCNPGSHMGEMVSENGVGWMLNPLEHDFGDRLYACYRAIDWHTFETNCDATLDGILREYHRGAEIVRRVCSSGQ